MSCFPCSMSLPVLQLFSGCFPLRSLVNPARCSGLFTIGALKPRACVGVSTTSRPLLPFTPFRVSADQQVCESERTPVAAWKSLVLQAGVSLQDLERLYWRVPSYACRALGCHCLCGVLSRRRLGADGALALTASNDSTAWIWSSATEECLLTFASHVVVFFSAVFLAGGASVLTASFDTTAKIWSCFTARLLSSHFDACPLAVVCNRTY